MVTTRQWRWNYRGLYEKGRERHTFAATAMHLLARTLEEAFQVVIMPNLQDEIKELSVSIFSSRDGSSLFLRV